MTEINFKVPEFTKLMREYADTVDKHKLVEPYCWRGMKRTLVENKRITRVYVTSHWIRFYETGDFPGSSWLVSNTYGLSDFIEWIFAKRDMLTDVSVAASTTASAISNISTSLGSGWGSDSCSSMIYTDHTHTVDIPQVGNAVVDINWDRLASVSSIEDTYVKKSDCKCCKNEEKKENKSMFNFDFGKVASDKVRLSMYGIAVKNIDGRYVAYDVKSHSVMDVEIMNMPCGDFLYKMPVAIKDIKAGDVVIHNKVPMFVIEVHDSTLKVVDIHEGAEKEIYLTKSPFGFNFATKVVSLIDFTGKADASNPFGNMLPFLMMGDGKMDDMLPMMMLMNGGKMDMSNPMFMYFMMKDNKESKDMLPFLLMGMGSPASK